MKHTIELDPDQQWAIIRYHGPVRPEDPVEIMEKLVAMPGWTPRCDRIVVYDDGQLGDVDAAAFRVMRDALSEIQARHYGPVPNYSAQVCKDPMQQPLVAFWLNFGERNYPAGLARFDTVEDAQAWLRRQREPKGRSAGPGVR